MASPAMSVDNIASTKDKDWVRSSFMLAVNRWNPEQGTVSKENKEWLYFTSAQYKSSNTSLGGNVTLNSMAQYTRTCDIPRGGLAYGQTGKLTVDGSMAGGMGRYYSEAIDDWSMKVSFRFGMPEYKGLITFFTSFYDVGAAILGRQGRLSKGLFYTGAKVITSLIALPLTVMVWVGEAVQWLSNRPSSRYYNLKPAMALYWQRVNLIANMMAANMGLTPTNPPNPPAGDVVELDPAFKNPLGEGKDTYAFEYFSKTYPNMFLPRGGIDIFYLANKHERMIHQRNIELRNMIAQGEGNWIGKLKTEMDKHVSTFRFRDPASPQATLEKYLDAYHGTRLGFADMGDPDFSGEDSTSRAVAQRMQNSAETFEVSSTSANSVSPDVALSEGATLEGEGGGGGGNATLTEANQALVDDAKDDGYIFPVLKEAGSDGQGGSVFEKVGDFAKEFTLHSASAARDGGQWVNFRVDAVKSVDESFTNTVGPSEIQGKLNGMSSSAAAVRFGMSDFKTGFGAIDGVVQGVRDVMAGVADGLHIGGLAALMGGGFVDIPQRWMDSSVSLPTASYTVKCRPPYGNVMSRFLNMHVIIACFLAAALPISYGRHAYGAPMLCEMYVQGKNQSRLAMITSLSITRGEGNLGWSKDGEFLGCDINFEVTDLSTIMHAPIDSGMNIIGDFRWIMSDDNVFNDYMAVLSNLSVGEMTYSWDKIKLNWSRYVTTQQSFLSPSRIAMIASDTTLGRIVRKVNPNQNPDTR